MANVLFKRGLQASLPTAGIDGAFYLTTDTHRLYMGYNGGVHQVNPGITKVAKVADLPASNRISASDYGQFYYATAENVLCIFDGGKWVQINPDTNIEVTEFANSVAVADNKATITSAITQEKEGVSLGDLEETLTVEGRAGITVAAATDNKGIILSGEGVSAAASVVTAEKDVKVALTSPSGTTNTSFDIVAGKDLKISVVGGKIQIDSTYEATADNYLNDLSASAEAAGFNITATMIDGTEHKTSIDPVIKIDSNSVHFANGEADLSAHIYSIADIDSMMKGFQAMEYQGAVSVLPTSSVKVGYTYVLKSDISSPVPAKTGDTVIARGTEGADGYISGTITWDVIPSGDDVHKDTVVSGASKDNGFVLTNSAGDGDEATVYDFSIAAGAHLAVSDSANAAGDKANIVTIKHTDTTRTDTIGSALGQSALNSLEVTAVTGVSSDAQGHITGIETTKVTLVDTTSTLVGSTDENYVATTVTSDVANKEASFNFAPVLKDSNGETSSDARKLSLASDSLTVTAANNKMHVDLVWEEWA